MIIKIAFRNSAAISGARFSSALTIAAGLIVFICMDSMLTGVDRNGISLNMMGKVK